jgi:hypothetical protein
MQRIFSQIFVWIWSRMWKESHTIERLSFYNCERRSRRNFDISMHHRVVVTKNWILEAWKIFYRTVYNYFVWNVRQRMTITLDEDDVDSNRLTTFEIIDSMSTLMMRSGVATATVSRAHHQSWHWIPSIALHRSHYTHPYRFTCTHTGVAGILHNLIAKGTVITSDCWHLLEPWYDGPN